MSTPTSNAAAYWRANLRLIAVLTAIWFVVSLGAGVIFVDALNSIRFFGFKLGFFFAQQGAIYVFVVLIFYYARRMEQLEREFDLEEDE